MNQMPHLLSCRDLLVSAILSYGDKRLPRGSCRPRIPRGNNRSLSNPNRSVLLKQMRFNVMRKGNKISSKTTCCHLQSNFLRCLVLLLFDHRCLRFPRTGVYYFGRSTGLLLLCHLFGKTPYCYANSKGTCYSGTLPESWTGKSGRVVLEGN